MKIAPRVLLPLLASIPLGAPVEQPSFRPESGASLTKHFVIESDVELDDFKLEVDGRDMSEMAGQVETAMKVSMKVSVTDSYETVSDGRPVKLLRSFEELSSNTHVSGSNPVMGQTEQDMPLESELEGTKVVFTWDADSSDYDVAFAGDEDAEQDLLEDLRADMDLSGFLPAGDVSEGDSWDVPVEAVRSLLAPGGNLKLRPTGDNESMGGMDQFSQNDMVGELEGDFTATYAGTREEDSAKVAVIKLRIEARSANDMSDQLEDIMASMKENMPEGVQVDISAMDIEYELDAEGELLWNLETNLVHEVQLSGEAKMIVDLSMNMSMGEQSQSMDTSQTYVGNQTISLTTGE